MMLRQASTLFAVSVTGDRGDIKAVRREKRRVEVHVSSIERSEVLSLTAGLRVMGHHMVLAWQPRHAVVVFKQALGVHIS